MSSLTIQNKDVFTSYLYTMAKYDFTIYEKRIIYRLVELAQDELSGLLLRDNLRKIHKRQRSRTITMPISSILKDERDENYSHAKRAFKSLSCKGLEYEDDKIWTFINIIAAPKFDKKSGSAIFDVYDEVWTCLLDFTQGYRRYELNTIMSFKSTYSMRMYELMSNQKVPLTFVKEGFESLCDRFKIPKSMRRAGSFEEKVLDVAMRELNESAPYSFGYERETIPFRGRNGQKVIGYTFYPIEITKNRDPNLEAARLAAKISHIDGRGGILDTRISDILHHLGFTKSEINANANKQLFLAAQKILAADGVIDAISKIQRAALKNGRVENLKGYIVRGLKTRLEEAERPKGWKASPTANERKFDDIAGTLAAEFSF